ncbi:retrovirus-related pol polyprotein from transposon TNT 1-94 [Tanacetum coccineum]
MFQRSRDDKNGKNDRKCFRCGDPNHLIGECPKPPKDKNQRAFVGGSWSDSSEEDDEKAKDETCLVAQASNEVLEGQICDNKCRVTFSEHDSEITKDGKVICRGIRKKGLYMMKLGNKPKDKICLATINENSMLWHKRLGHGNMRLIQSLASKELVRNLPKLTFDQHFCDACKIGKQAHASHKAKNIVSTTRCLELLHMDLFGPFAVRSYGGNLYTLVIVDDYSMYTWIIFLKNKTEAFEQFEIFSKKIQNQLGCSIVSIRTDHGREFNNECNLESVRNREKTPSHLKYVVHPPMLETSLYDSWKSRIELYIENQENGRMILNSLQNGPLVWPTFVKEDGTTRTKKYEEQVAEKLQADCDHKATNIVLQCLPPVVYAIVNHHKVGKEIWDRVKLLMQGTKLSLQEKECKLYDEFDKFSFVKGETLYQYYSRFDQLINDMNVINMSMRPIQVNTKFLNSLPPGWSKFVTDVKLARDLHTANYDQLYSYLEQHEAHANETRLMRE